MFNSMFAFRSCCVVWFGCGLSASPQGSCVGNLVGEPLRARTKYKSFRSLEPLLLEGVTSFLGDPNQLFLSEYTLFKSSRLTAPDMRAGRCLPLTSQGVGVGGEAELRGTADVASVKAC